jgi:class 3 adenylate cyclase/tetratricopeptide (TPR) repeat protein
MAACPSCGEENPERAKFCLECGAPLGEPARAPSEERKYVTVLFCDLVGFTARSDEADPEDVRAAVRPYYARLRRELERYGGTVEKFIGDAVMAVFGAPVAHEDDAERAVRAGLRILETIDELNDEEHLDLAVRIGINTGEAVVALGARPTEGEGLVSGDVVNTAARLQSAAPQGGIAVGESTYLATRDVFDYEPLDAVTVKGKSRPLSVWRARRARARFGSDLRRHAASLVGRDVEKGLLQGLFERAARDTSVQLVTIVGEPGVGKSRLVFELGLYVEDHPDLITWREGRCLPYGEGITFWALGEIVKAEAGILESDPPDTVAAKLERAVPETEPDREWLKARLGPLVGLGGPTADREESFTAWRRFLEALAASRRTVLVFEDLHWADPALLEFLEHVADWSEGIPLLLVCTARPELYERNPHWAGGKRNATTINLSPLSRDETAQLVSVLLDQAALPAEVQTPLVERADGNPLYAEEFVRMLIDRGLLVRMGRTWVLAEDVEIPFPESVQALIAARLDTLAAERKALLQDAAVIGQVFWAGAVAAMGDRDERTVREALHELSRKEVVRPARATTMEGEVEYSFAHLLIRDVAYAQIPRTSRADRHRLAADWIETKAGARVEDLADVLAHHYVEALELTRSAGGDDEELVELAVRFLTLAGNRALRLDVARAEQSYARALELIPPDHREYPRLLLDFGRALALGSRQKEAKDALERAVEICRAAGARIETARALLLLAGPLARLADPRERSIIEEAVAILEGEDVGPDLVNAYETMAVFWYRQGIDADAGDWAERALTLAREQGLPEPVRALSIRGSSRLSQGERQGREDLDRALELGLARGLGRETAAIYNDLGLLLMTIDGPVQSLASYRKGIDFAQRRGLAEIEFILNASMLESLYHAGEWDEVLELSASLERETDVPRDLVAVRHVKADTLVSRGELERADELIEWLLGVRQETAETQFVLPVLTIAAQVRLARGRRSDTAGLLTELERLPEAFNSWNVSMYLPKLVRTATAFGDLALGERFVSSVPDVSPANEAALASARAALAEARGSIEEAAPLYAAAADTWKRLGYVYEQAHALLGSGRCLRALGATDAGPTLETAGAIFDRLGARPALQEVETELVHAVAAG